MSVLLVCFRLLHKAHVCVRTALFSFKWCCCEKQVTLLCVCVIVSNKSVNGCSSTISLQAWKVWRKLSREENNSNAQNTRRLLERFYLISILCDIFREHYILELSGIYDNRMFSKFLTSCKSVSYWPDSMGSQFLSLFTYNVAFYNSGIVTTSV